MLGLRAEIFSFPAVLIKLPAFAKVALAQPRQRGVEYHLRIFGIELQGFAIARHGLFGASHGEIGVAEIDVGMEEARVELERPCKLGERFVEMVGLREGDAAKCQRIY